MKKVFVWALLLSLSIGVVAKKNVKVQPQWPDGSVMSEWFADTAKVSIAGLGRQYVITDYGVGLDSTIVQTEKIQQIQAEDQQNAFDIGEINGLTVKNVVLNRVKK